MKVSIAGGLIIVIIIGWAAEHFHNELLMAKKAELAVRKELQQSQSVLHNTMAAVTLLRDITRITHEDRQRNHAESEKRIARIRREVHEDACAHQPVPAAVTDQLRAHRERIRARSRRSGSTGIAGGV